MSDYTDIQQELDDFENAVYGEEVRDSMISAIKKIHDVAESAAEIIDSITKYLSLGKVNDTLYLYWNGVQIGIGVPLPTGGGDVTPDAYEDIVLSDNKLHITTTANDPTLIDGTLYFV